MGGMAVLEWPLCTEPGYVRHIIPIATSARHSAWCISWGEAQRQSIYSDPDYADGYYPQGTQPYSGLAAARMAALLTYRSRDSFEARFGRRPQKPKEGELPTPPQSPGLSTENLVAAHNDGLRNVKGRPKTTLSETSTTPPETTQFSRPTVFSAQSYLRYQGDKFNSRFDANCYIHITRKLDTHDVARERFDPEKEDGTQALKRVLSLIPPRALVIGIQTDGLFTISEQREIAQHVPEAELVVINSPDGHDGFLLEFEQINHHILSFLKKEYPRLYEGSVDKSVEGFEIKKTSLFGEAEADVARW